MRIGLTGTNRWLAVWLGLVAMAATVLPAQAEEAAGGDYQQVVDITFPFTADVDVHYPDTYDASRGGGRNHQATDLMVAGGTPVHAVMGGTVSWLSGHRVNGPPSYGWMVRIAGDDGRDYAYVHLGWQDRPWGDAYAPGIDRGTRVERGDLIGWAACSGSATCGGGEHLHIEIHDDTVVDPYDYHDHERINPYWSLVAAEERGDYPAGDGRVDTGTVTQDTAPQERGFLDVTRDNVHRRDIAALAEAGITTGCGPDSFCPADVVTREQMATFLTRAFDFPVTVTAGNPFTDVTDDNVHVRNIAALAKAGITTGCGPDSFCPGQPVTRQQMASFLTRALGLRG